MLSPNYSTLGLSTTDRHWCLPPCGVPPRGYGAAGPGGGQLALGENGSVACARPSGGGAMLRCAASSRRGTGIRQGRVADFQGEDGRAQTRHVCIRRTGATARRLPSSAFGWRYSCGRHARTPVGFCDVGPWIPSWTPHPCVGCSVAITWALAWPVQGRVWALLHLFCTVPRSCRALATKLVCAGRQGTPHITLSARACRPFLCNAAAGVQKATSIPVHA